MKQAYSPLSGTLQRLADAFEVQGLLAFDAEILSGAQQNSGNNRDVFGDGAVVERTVIELVSVEHVNDELLIDISVYKDGSAAKGSGLRFALPRRYGRWANPGSIEN